MKNIINFLSLVVLGLIFSNFSSIEANKIIGSVDGLVEVYNNSNGKYIGKLNKSNTYLETNGCFSNLKFQTVDRKFKTLEVNCNKDITVKLQGGNLTVTQ